MSFADCTCECRRHRRNGNAQCARSRSDAGMRQDLRAGALPPLRPAAFFCAVVPPCDELLFDELDEPDFLPPRLDAPDELAIFAARSFDIPLSFSASYCFSFFTFELLPGMNPSSWMTSIRAPHTPICRKNARRFW